MYRIPNNWIPRKDQMDLWTYLERGGTRAVEVAHRRWGKDDVALHFTATKAVQEPGNYWHMLPAYNQARKVVWNAVNPKTGKRRIDEAFPSWVRKRTHEQEMLIEFKSGSVWQLVGSDNYNSLMGSPPRGIVYSEYSIANPMAWAYLMPILEENGGWALFIYTPRGSNHGMTMLRHAEATAGWFGQTMSADKTPVFRPEQLETIRQEYVRLFGPDLGEALYQQEYMCSFEGAVLGAYFARQLAEARKEGRITSVPWQRGFEVDTYWDLGVDDSMAIWFIQHIGLQHHVIDYYENTGYGLEHYAKVMKDKPYTYGNHYMPHDAEAREMTNSEIAKSRKEVAQDLGIKPVIVVPRAKNMDMIVQVHIPAVRNILGSCWFDAVKCEHGLSALEGFKAEYDEEKKKLSNRPLHDWTSHGSSAFITFAVGYKPKTIHKSVTSIMSEMRI
jgi:phage terminase large subunit